MPRVSVTRVVAATQQDVWSVISDLTKARRWNASWANIEITSHQTHGAGTEFRAHTEDGDTFEFRVSDWVAPEYISFTPLRDPSERYSIALESHSFRLRPVGEDATEVDLIAEASAHGVRGRFIAMFFWSGYQKQGMEAVLDAIQEIFEGSPELETESPNATG